MSIVSTILNKEIISLNSQLNIIWTDCTDKDFKGFIESLGHNLISFNDLYYGALDPHLIICNNKLQFFDECKMFSIQYHLPVLLIDHSIKSHLLDKDKISLLNMLPCSYSVAMSKKISESWNSFHNQILTYDKNNTESRDVWKNLIYQTAKRLFTM